MAAKKKPPTFKRTLLYDTGFEDDTYYLREHELEILFDQDWDKHSLAVLEGFRKHCFEKALEAVSSHVDVGLVLFQIRESLGLSTEGYTNHRVLEEEPQVAVDLYPPEREYPRKQ